MAQSIYSNRTSKHQFSLLDQALHQLSRIDPPCWDDMPTDLQTSFARYMGVDAWTGRPDLLTLREAALMIIRDAISRTGEFSDEIPASAGAAGPK